MERKSADHLRGTLQTPIGELEYALTEANHVHIGNPTGTLVTVNRVPYHISAHLTLNEQGEWVISERLYMTNRDHDSATQAASNKVLAIVPKVWKEFVTEDLRKRAEANNVNNQIIRQEETVKELKKKLQEQEQRLQDLLLLEELGAVPPHYIAPKR